MLRDRLFSPFVQKELQTEWRGREITRIEGFSDAVFGFAVTLLVVALEVPRTSGELIETMRGFGGFLITFGILFSIWYRQFIFFRRYGLEDRTTVVLNGMLLVVVLFFVYPLKFLFTSLLNRVLGEKFVVLADGSRVPTISPEHFPILMAIYGFGLSAIFIVFALLYRHAYRNRDILKLTDVEAYDTRDTFTTTVWIAAAGSIIGGTSALSLLLAQGSSDAFQLGFAALQVVIVIKLLRIRMTRRTRRGKFLAELSAKTEALP